MATRSKPQPTNGRARVAWVLVCSVVGCLLLILVDPVRARLGRLALAVAVAQQERTLRAELTRGHRSIRGRTTWRLEYLPFDPVRSAGGLAPTESPDAVIAIAKLEKYAITNPSMGLEALGIARLTTGQVSSAIDALERARDLNVGHGAVLVNLSAAYFERGAPGDLVRALDSSLTALRIGQDTAEARFNVALAGSRLLPPSWARQHWEMARDADTDDGWRREIAESVRLSNHRVDAVAASSGGLWLEVFERALPQWAAACLSGDGAAAEVAGEHVRSLVGQLSDSLDRYPVELARFVSQPSSSRCNADRAKASRVFIRARAAYRSDDLSGAAALFDEAAAAFAGEEGPLLFEAQVYGAVSHYFDGRDRGAAIKALISTMDRADARHYFRVAAKAAWMIGYVRQDVSDFQGALDAYEDALSASTKAGDDESAVTIEALIASVYDWMGDYSRGWLRRERVLAQLSSVADPRALQTILGSSTRAALRDGFASAALQFSDATLAASRQFASEARISESELERARIAHLARDEVVAQAAVSAAEAAARHVTAPMIVARLRANVSATQAEIATEPAESKDRLTHAIDFYRSGGADIVLAHLFLRRARAEIALGDDASAERDLADGIVTFEHVRRSLRDAAWRISYFDEAWDLFDEAINRRWVHGDTDSALDLAERAQARSMLDAVGGPQAAAGAHLRARLNAGTVVVRLISLDDKLAMWALSRDHSDVRTVRVSRRILQAKVAAFSSCLVRQRDPADCREHSTQLFTLLVKPIATGFAGASRVVFVPDSVLQRVPFAALWDPARQRYLVDDFDISYSPSLATVASGSSPWFPATNALVVGVSADGEAPLPYAVSEARRIAGLYPNATLLLERDATRERFLEELPRHDVVHFAGHALMNPENPELSRLLLQAPDASRSSVVFGYEIARQHLTNVRVVLLAACDTASGRTYKSEGVVSLARQFMAAGVPTVVATLWPISDRAAAFLFECFHMNLQAGESPGRALRNAQRESINASADIRGVWPAIVIFDSSSDSH